MLAADACKSAVVNLLLHSSFKEVTVYLITRRSAIQATCMPIALIWRRFSTAMATFKSTG